MKANSSLKNRSPVLFIFLAFIFCILSSCVAPFDQYTKNAANYGLEQNTLETTFYEHIYYSNSGTIPWKNKNRLHIYIEGDGSPWIDGNWIALDPSPRNPVMLNLMSLDDSPAVLLGRPCYHQDTRQSQCDSKLWTSARYSKNVIESMASAITALQKKHKFKEVVLFGHSGGGVIATLIANLQHQQPPNISAIITLAANLDTDAWTTNHGFLPLEQSLNPALLPPSNSKSLQIHLYGGLDDVVDHTLLNQYFFDRPNLISEVYSEFDHSCCWASIWPNTLHMLRIQIQNSLLNPAATE